MDAQFVFNLLAQRHSGPEWAFFGEFRPVTGFASRVADALAIGLWRKNSRIIAYEIKVTRADFMNDIKNFREKHEMALGISEEFFYVCPYNMVRVDEVPDVVGLMFVDSSNGLKVVKVAPIRTKECLPFDYVQAIAREAGAKIDVSKIPAKYLGHDISQEDLKKIIDGKVSEVNQWQIDRAAEKKVEGLQKSESMIRKSFVRMRTAAGLHYSEDEYVVDEIVKRLTIVSQMDGLLHSIKSVRSLSDETIRIIEKLRKDPEGKEPKEVV